MKKLVLFSGAGMSAESGIQTFRDSNGLWENNNIEDVATPQAWRRSPSLVQEFYNQRRKQIINAEPNEGHAFIVELQKTYDVQVITQNIDDLHERAGCKKVLHLHGNIRQAKSSGPNQEKKYYNIEGWKLELTALCDDGYPLRPHVVWFGEEVPMLEVAAGLISEANVFIAIGTSLNVYPAAGLVHCCGPSCAKVIIDPKVDELSVPFDFEQIKMKAVDGLSFWHKKKAH
jgi:NAD-dependent deacetylase